MFNSLLDSVFQRNGIIELISLWIAPSKEMGSLPPQTIPAKAFPDESRDPELSYFNEIEINQLGRALPYPETYPVENR